MNDIELLLRQQRLLSRSQALRQELAGQVSVLARPLATVDLVQRGISWLYCHPLWSLGVVTLLVVSRPGRTLRWTGRLWWAWQSWQRVRRAIGH